MGTYALSAGYYDAYYKRAQQVWPLSLSIYIICFNDELFGSWILFLLFSNKMVSYRSKMQFGAVVTEI